MRALSRIALCCAFCLLVFTTAAAQKSPKPKVFATEGVFSNIAVGEGGDYGGMQVYLTDSDGQFYATVTVAQGVLLPPQLVKVQVQVEQRKIAFTLGEGDDARKFTGVVTAEGLALEEEGNKLFLKRKCSD